MLLPNPDFEFPCYFLTFLFVGCESKGTSINLLRTMITSFTPTWSGLHPPCIPMESGLMTIYRGARNNDELSAGLCILLINNKCSGNHVMQPLFPACPANHHVPYAKNQDGDK